MNPFSPKQLPHWIDHVRSEVANLEQQIANRKAALAAVSGTDAIVLTAKLNATRARLVCEMEVLRIYEHALATCKAANGGAT